jgi:diguanylate cyclase
VRGAPPGGRVRFAARRADNGGTGPQVAPGRRAMRSHPHQATRVAGPAFWAVVLLATLAYGPLLAGGLGARPALDGAYRGALVAVAAGGSLLAAFRSERDRRERGGWLALGAGLLAWSAGELVSAVARDAPAADGLRLALVPAVAAGLALLVRSRLARAGPGPWLDGLVAVLAAGAVGAAVFLPATVAADPGSPLLGVLHAAGDTLLAGLGLALLALSGWRPHREWLVLGAALVVAGVAHAASLEPGVAAGHAPEGPGAWLWLASLALVAWAGWQPPQWLEQPPLEGWRQLAARIALGGLALAVLVYAALDRDSAPAGVARAWAVGLAAAALAALMARTVLTVRENIRLGDSHRQALTDDLTGLPNRRLFFDRAEQAILHTGRNGTKLAILLMDLDRFKEVNDTLGHHSGDVLLKAISRRLRAALRATDTLARLGGDEFAVILPVVQSRASARWVAGTLRSAVSAPVEMGQLVLDSQASVGVAMFPDDGHDVATLLQRADVAMYMAKHTQTGIEFYAPEHDENSLERLALVAELRRAIEREELVLHYQPQVDMATGGVGAVEVLVRWQHPERGLLPPADFVPTAEHTALITPLTLYVLDHALAQCRRWEEQGLRLSVAVNVSVPQLLDLELPGELERLLERHGIGPGRLELEMTETVLMADPARALEVLTRISRLGVTLAIDDFGVGYSSLRYLKELPVDVLKIDRSFVASMTESPEDAMIVRSTIDLGRNLGMKVIAEGVEDQAALEELRALGCHVGQGYHLSHPVPADELTEWLLRPSTPTSALAGQRG